MPASAVASSEQGQETKNRTNVEPMAAETSDKTTTDLADSEHQ
jgi:hypothetical protein